MAGFKLRPVAVIAKNRHLTKPGRVTIAGNRSDDLSPGTLNSILKQAGLREKQ